jgi:hypothetical protein
MTDDDLPPDLHPLPHLQRDHSGSHLTSGPLSMAPRRSDDDAACDSRPAPDSASARQHDTPIHRPRGIPHRPIDEPTYARVWDCLAGGSRNTPIDRELAERITANFPGHALALSTCRYQYRVVTELLDRGVSQFLDLGCGLLTHGGIHDIAQNIGVEARTVYVYVDHDPDVVHAIALGLTDTRTVAIHADIREPDALLAHPGLRAVLALDRPVAVLAFGVLDTIADTDRPGDRVTALADAFAPGSYLALSHLTDDTASPALRAQLGAAITLFGETGTTLIPRDTATVASWLTHLEVLTPGVCLTEHWRPDHPTPPQPHQQLLLGAIAQTLPRSTHPAPPSPAHTA